jgi:hypothetical protein
LSARAKRAAALAAIAVAVVALVVGRRMLAPRKGASAGAGFTFCAAHADAPRQGEGTWSYPLVFGVLLSLSAEEGAALERALDEANRRWQARANPFTEDLEDTDPDEALTRWLEGAPASAGVAMAAARTRYCATDGFCVAVAPSGSPCREGWVRLAADSPEMARARFLAWPFGYAAFLRAETPEGARDAARALRSNRTHVGLVLHARDEEEAKRRVPGLVDRLRRHEILRRAASLRGDESSAGRASPFRAADGEEADAAPLPAAEFPARLGDLDVVVLPRLEIVKEPDALEREVLRAAPGLHLASD